MIILIPNFEFQILDREDAAICPSDYSDFRNLVQLSWFGQEQIFSIYVNYFFKGIIKFLMQIPLHIQ